MAAFLTGGENLPPIDFQYHTNPGFVDGVFASLAGTREELASEAKREDKERHEVLPLPMGSVGSVTGSGVVSSPEEVSTTTGAGAGVGAPPEKPRAGGGRGDSGEQKNLAFTRTGQRRTRLLPVLVDE